MPARSQYRLRARASVALFLLAALPVVGCARRDATATWPSAPVRLVVPFGAGASTDLAARLIAPRLARRWGKPVVVDNRPGGDGMAGAQAFVTAQDPNSLLFSPLGIVTTNPLLHARLPFDPDADLMPVAGVVSTGITVAVSSSFGASSLAELSAISRGRRAPLLWSATAGLPELVGRALLATAKIDARYVPYAELASAVRDLSVGRLEMLVTALPTVAVARGTQRVRLLAVATAERSPSAPDVPTLREAGYPTLTVEGPQGLFGGRGMDSALRARIATDVAAVIAEPALRAQLDRIGFAAGASTAEAFASAIRAQRVKARAFLTLAGGIEKLRR